MKRFLEGMGQTMVTFAPGTNAAAGKVCKMSGNLTVAPCSAGDAFCGWIDHVGNAGAATVVRGFVTVKYTGSTAPSVGFSQLVADGSGGVKVDTTNGSAYLAVDVDTTAATVTILL